MINFIKKFLSCGEVTTTNINQEPITPYPPMRPEVKLFLDRLEEDFIFSIKTDFYGNGKPYTTYVFHNKNGKYPKVSNWCIILDEKILIRLNTPEIHYYLKIQERAIYKYYEQQRNKQEQSEQNSFNALVKYVKKYDKVNL